MRRERHIIAAMLGLLALAATQSGCHLLARQRKPSRAQREIAQLAAKSRRPLQRIGMVALVNEADGFALIDSGSIAPPVVGAKLVSYTGTEPSAELKASAVRRRPFVVADLVSGKPRPGDEVFEMPSGAPVVPVSQ